MFNIDKEIKESLIKLNLLIDLIADIETSPASRNSKDNRLCYLPKTNEISLEPFAKECINIYDNKLGILIIGIGYNGDCLAERTYSFYKGIKYNFSEWNIINKYELNKVTL